MAWTKERFEREAGVISGAECLYRERPIFVHARVTAVSAKEDRLFVVFEPLPSPGFAPALAEHLLASTSWDGLRDDLSMISAPYADFFAYFCPELVRATVAFAASLEPLPEALTDQETVLARYLEIGRFVGGYRGRHGFAARRPPNGGSP